MSQLNTPTDIVKLANAWQDCVDVLRGLFPYVALGMMPPISLAVSSSLPAGWSCTVLHNYVPPYNVLLITAPSIDEASRLRLMLGDQPGKPADLADDEAWIGLVQRET